MAAPLPLALAADVPPGTALPAPEELDRVLAVAIEAAHAAGVRIAAALGTVTTAETKASAADIVTEVDKAAQEIIAARVRASFPEDAFLGEEDVAPGSAASAAALAAVARAPRCWVVDPLDGTTNFFHGLPASTVSIAVAAHGVLVVGVVHDP
jgi:myo-inositol-1(or 4)-monophosphatase